jgi:tetratricopeptide (TPR) repeat protein
MNPERFAVVKELLADLEGLPEAERTAYLDRACAGDAELREDVASLMRADIPSLMQTGGLAARVAPILTDDRGALGRTIGPYRLMDVLGEGGMGVVYQAEQIEPIHREVALKLVAPGMDSARVVSRFESERQALALMNHPYIAQALEAGTGEDGRPYFVMELVRGEPVTEYCAREKPPLSARLQLFLRICEAIQHAHQRGIIHRDLKPSNVLLTKQGADLVPKVIDFGIAKAIGDAERKMLLTTIDGQIVGTPEYMSPEQAGVIDAGVDTRTDVYSLGVILYELVSGQRPYVLKKRTALELERAMRTPPPPPSQLRSPEGPRTPRSQAARDIDAVALMAMELTPDDRYQSVEQLADDVRRVIDQRPIRARTQTWTYRAERFVRRNAVAVATASVVAAVGVAAIVGIVLERNRAIASEKRAVSEAAHARAEAAKASEVARFLTNLFQESDPAHARGATVTARELLDRGAERLSTELTSQEATRATLMDTIGSVYLQLGLNDASEKITTEALAIRRRVLGPEHPDIAASLDSLGQIARARSRFERAEAFHREALAMRRKLLPRDDPAVAESLSHLGLTLRERGKYGEGRTLVQEALAIRRAKLGPEHEDTLVSMNVLGDIEFESGHRPEAERWYRDVLTIRRKLLPPDHPSVASGLTKVARVLAEEGRPADAESLFREALAIRRKILGPNHTELADTINSLASATQDLGRFDEAEALYREALAIDRRRDNGININAAVDLNNLASLLEDRDRLAEAGTMYEESMRMSITLQGEKHPLVATLVNNLGHLRLAQGQLAEAERQLRRSIEIRTALGTPRHSRVAQSMLSLGRVYELRGHLADAETQYAGALDIARAASPKGSPVMASALVAVGRIKVRRKDPAGGEPSIREGLAFRRQNLPPGHRTIGDAEAALGDCLLQESKSTEAEPLLQSALKTAPTNSIISAYARPVVLGLIVRLYEKSGRPDDAAKYRAQLGAKEGR